jgi:hypothetical protein
MTQFPRFLPRLLLCLALAYPVGLAIIAGVPQIFQTSSPDVSFIAQAVAIALMPAFTLVLFAFRTLLGGVLAGLSIIALTFLLLLPFGAIEAP